MIGHTTCDWPDVVTTIQLLPSSIAIVENTYISVFGSTK
jgi:hypothetical protein